MRMIAGLAFLATVLLAAMGVTPGHSGASLDERFGWGVNPEGGIEAWLVTGFPFDELVFTHE